MTGGQIDATKLTAPRSIESSASASLLHNARFTRDRLLNMCVGDVSKNRRVSRIHMYVFAIDVTQQVYRLMSGSYRVKTRDPRWQLNRGYPRTPIFSFSCRSSP